MNTTQRGFIVPLLLVIIALLIVGGGAYVYTDQTESQSQVTQATSTTDTQAKVNQPSRLIIDPSTVKVGDVFGPWTVKSVAPIGFDSTGTRISGGVDFTGNVTFKGRLSDNPYTGAQFAPDSADLSKMPMANFETESRGFTLNDSDEVYLPSGELTPLFKSLLDKDDVTIEVQDFHLPFGAGNPTTAEFVRVIQ